VLVIVPAGALSSWIAPLLHDKLETVVKRATARGYLSLRRRMEMRRRLTLQVSGA
jgi:hypothetical protein